MRNRRLIVRAVPASLSVIGIGLSCLGCVPLPTGGVFGAPRDTALVVEDFRGPLLAEKRWQIDPTLSGIAFSEDALLLRSAPSQTAYIKARFLQGEGGLAGQLGGTTELLEWRARVRQSGTYFILVDAVFSTAPLRVQLAPYGLHVTSAAPGQQATGQEFTRPEAWRTADHTWRLERRGAELTLAADGETLWQGQVSGTLSSLVFGESSVDPLHGGEMRLEGVRWQRGALPGSRIPLP